jgi:hypothetical protein
MLGNALAFATGTGSSDGAASSFWESIDLAGITVIPRSTRYLPERLLAQQTLQSLLNFSGERGLANQTLRNLRDFSSEQDLVAETLRNT